jgi:hypothetical protein
VALNESPKRADLQYSMASDLSCQEKSPSLCQSWEKPRAARVSARAWSMKLT